MEIENKKNCSYCKKEYDDLIEIDNEYYCEDCANEFFVICEYCGEYVNRDDVTISEYNKCYCTNCSEEHLFRCYECNCYYPNDESICTVNGHLICSNCYSEDYVTCTICSDVIEYDDAFQHDDNYYCDYCYEQEISTMGIHDYDYSPDDFVFYNEDDEDKRNYTLHVGIELEIQGDDKKGFCQDIFSQYSEECIYMKEDGSLDSTGVEIVSHPMSLKYLLNGHEWKNIFDLMNKYNMNDTENCGLHFHLDKQYLNNNMISTIDYIVNNFQNYFAEIGGRNYNECSRYCKTVVKTDNQWGCFRIGDTRYQAVNLRNEDTVELRFCKSTDDYNTFIQRVKMIFAIVEFCKNCNIKDIMKYDLDSFKKDFEQIMNNLF